MKPAIEGHIVTESGHGISGIQVSNGLDIGRTDETGRYELPLYEGRRFVFMMLPAGYKTPRFYADLHHETNFDFVLTDYPASREEAFSFVQITDMHISTTRRAFSHHLKEDLNRILQDVGDRIQFIVATGDLTAGGLPEEYRAYLEAMETVELPVYHAAGNHDDDTEAAGKHFMDHLGPLYYSFDYGPVHFAVYDGEHYVRHPSGKTAEHVADDFPYVPSPQDDWLRADLSSQPPERPVVIINHFPWGDEFYRQWRDFPIIATLSGHWHSSRLYHDGRITHYNSPTLGFGGIDQSPRAYRLFSYKNGTLEAETRTLAASNIFPGISFRPDPESLAGQVRKHADMSPQPAADWPMFQSNSQRTGCTQSSLLTPLTPVWCAGTGGGIHMASPILIDGQIVQAVKNEDKIEGNGLVSLDARQGTLCWSFATQSAVKQAPAGSDGCVFAVTMTGEVVALSAAEGDQLWTYQLGDPSQRWVYSGPLVCDGRVYVGVSSHLVALNQSNGAVVWRREDLGPNDWISSYASPAAMGGYVAVAFYTQPTTLAVLDADTGETIWRIEGSKPNYMYASPVISPEGSIYTVSGSMVRSFELSTGELRWETPVSIQRVQSTPALADGRLFVAAGTGTLYALDADDGRELWQWEAGVGAPLFTPYAREGGTTLTTPVVSNGYVYLGGADGYLYALETNTGACVWQHNLEIPLAAAPAISGNGLWIGGCDGFVYAFVGS